jgi:membrane-associated protease RseP (regulator of RpoE activity)
MPDPSSDPLHGELLRAGRLPADRVPAYRLPEVPVEYRPLPRPRYRLPLLLLLVTFCTTVLVGARLQFNFDHHLAAFATGNEWLPLFPVQWIWRSPRLLLRGIFFSLAIMSILLAHELGHYFYCRRYRVRATLPYFMPAPTLIGTLGAFIRIGGPIPSREALFDIGIAGPIAGFVVAVPTMLIGLALSRPVATVPDPDLQFGFPLIFQLGHLLLRHVFSHAGGASLAHVYLHPVAIAAWAGMLATALNLLPGGQLDGGHLVFAVAPRLHRYVSWAVVVSLLAMSWYCWVGWLLWAILLTLTGLRHPRVPRRPGMGRARRRMALVALAMLVLTFTPAPVVNANFAQVAHMMRHGGR